MKKIEEMIDEDRQTIQKIAELKSERVNLVDGAAESSTVEKKFVGEMLKTSVLTDKGPVKH